MPTALLPADTAFAAAPMQFAVFGRMEPWRRLRLAMEMSDAARRLAARGIQDRHPDDNDNQVQWPRLDRAYLRKWAPDLGVADTLENILCQAEGLATKQRPES